MSTEAKMTSRLIFEKRDSNNTDYGSENRYHVAVFSASMIIADLIEDVLICYFSTSDYYPDSDYAPIEHHYWTYRPINYSERMKLNDKQLAQEFSETIANAVITACIEDGAKNNYTPEQDILDAHFTRICEVFFKSEKERWNNWQREERLEMLRTRLDDVEYRRKGILDELERMNRAIPS